MKNKCIPHYKGKAEKPSRATIVMLIFGIVVAIGIISMFAIIITGFLKTQQTRKETQQIPVLIEEGDKLILTRSLAELRNVLPELPEDLEAKPYTANIPDMVKNDVDLARSKSDSWQVIYQSEGKTKQLIFEKDQYDDENADGIRVTCVDRESYLLSSSYDKSINDNISMYKDGEEIIVYGTDNKGYKPRATTKYVISEERARSDSIATTGVGTRPIDLFGVSKDYEAVSVYREYMTPARNGNKFRFYHMGEPIQMAGTLGDTVEFPGAEIVEWNYYYILDSNNDMYYYYYCNDPDGPWMYFQKVAENIDKVTDDSVQIGIDKVGYKGRKYVEKLDFRVYEKDGERYVAIPDIDTLKTYGYNYGANHDASTAPDYTVRTEKITADNISAIELTVDPDDDSDRYIDWFQKIIYGQGEHEVYMLQRINGLDYHTSKEIPEEEINELKGKRIQLEEVPDYIAKLKELYAKYEKQYQYE